MPRIQPISDEILNQDYGDLLSSIREVYGSEPSSFGLLALVPGLLEIAGELSTIVMGPGTVDTGLKWMVAHVSSMAAGCRYCSAHSAYHAARSAGVDPEKVAAVWEYATDAQFSRAERAALTLALGASQTPNASTDADFEELKENFTDEQIAELVAVVALFGFFNRWNDTLKSELESAPAEFANQYIKRIPGR